MIYDPFSRNHDTVARVRVRDGRVARVIGVAPSIDPKAPRVRRVKVSRRKNAKTVKRITYRG
jgi:hypothetical protein